MNVACPELPTRLRCSSIRNRLMDSSKLKVSRVQSRHFKFQSGTCLELPIQFCMLEMPNNAISFSQALCGEAWVNSNATKFRLFVFIRIRARPAQYAYRRQCVVCAYSNNNNNNNCRQITLKKHNNNRILRIFRLVFLLTLLSGF